MANSREKAIEAIAKDPNRLIKTNPIINAKFDVTSIQMKVFLKVIATLDQSQDEMPEVRISVKEFQEFIGGNSKNIYTHLQRELTKLRKKDIYYEDEFTKLEASFFSSIEYKKKEGYFEFEFSKKLKPFLLQIKENFTVLDIRNILYLDSIYSIRFYEFCKEFERIKSFEFEVEDLKQKFGLADRYKNYFDFKLKVLLQAQEELKQKSELYFTFEEVKQGKKITHLRFKIINSKTQKQLIDETQKQQMTEIQTAVAPYIDANSVKKWFEKFTYEQIKAGVDYTLARLKVSEIKDVAKYLQKMVATPIDNQTTEVITPKPDKIPNLTDYHDLQASLKKEYFEKKIQLAQDILQTNPALYRDLLENLKDAVNQPICSILEQLAFQNYKLNPDVAPFDEFLANFNQEGSFQSYILEKLTTTHQEFSLLKATYSALGEDIGLKPKDFF